MSKIRLFIFIGFIVTALFTLFYFLILGRCDGEAEIYKLEIKGKLVDKYFDQAPHLKFYIGKDTIQPIGVYNQDLVESIEAGDSLYKPAFNDTGYIYKKTYGGVTKVIYNYTRCSCNERLKIKKEADASRFK